MTDITQPPRATSPFAPKPKNGGEVVALPALPGNHQSALEMDIRRFHEARAQLEANQKLLEEERIRARASEAVIQQLESAINAAESRVVSATAERDLAVLERGVITGKYETLFNSVRLLLEAFVPPVIEADRQ